MRSRGPWVRSVRRYDQPRPGVTRVCLVQVEDTLVPMLMQALEKGDSGVQEEVRVGAWKFRAWRG